MDFLNFSSLVMKIDAMLWATPLIALTFGLAVAYCIAIKFGNVTLARLQWQLLTHGEGSGEGLSAFETFCSVAAYRVAVGNIGGVMVAIMYGGPGSVFWMLITALVTSAIAYAENCLGQVYKVRQDGQYRGGPYFYMERGITIKPLGKFMAICFALFATIGVPFLVTGPSANNIVMAFENSFGVNRALVGLIVAVLLFLVISGGVRRIAKISVLLVPFMTVGYLIVTVVVLIVHASNIPATLQLMLGSAFNSHAVFGGMMGGAFSYGVKRAVNSSGSGFGETPPAAAAAETPHPATQGLVNAFSVYIDVAVCLCSGIMAIVSNCFNVLGPDGVSYMYVGEGSAVMQAQASTNTAGVVWVQEAANSAIPSIGGMLIAIALTCFAYSTCIAYYYEGESGLAYLCRNMREDVRRKLIWGIRIIMPVFFFIWANVTATTAWAVSEIMFALMSWFNLVALIFLLPNVKKIYDDYHEQRARGVKEPYFNPEKLNIKDCELWMEINRERIEADRNH
ncbi:MAG: alanine/glycine:cation symporter family protein [Stomatobaculum sp.]